MIEIEKYISKEKAVISASRTRDVVRTAPGVLADILEGNRDCLLRRGGSRTRISLNNIHTVVLWTKNPFNLLRNEKLYTTLNKFTNKYEGLIYLHLTVTGFGSTFIEYGIPDYRDIAEFLVECFNTKLLFPESICIRYDPFGEIGVAEDIILSNMQTSVFEDIVNKFSSIGIKSFITSRMDAVRYPFVQERIDDLGLQIYYPSDEDAIAFITQLDNICKSRQVEFKVCCDPNIRELRHRRGCVDGRIFNQLKKKYHVANPYTCTTLLHNEVTGGQRGTCRCTYSQDIGYSKGISKCYSTGFGCIYCYSQHGINKDLARNIRSEIEGFEKRLDIVIKENIQYKQLIVNRPYCQRINEKSKVL
jgi:hypothetical protein